MKVGLNDSAGLDNDTFSETNFNVQAYDASLVTLTDCMTGMLHVLLGTWLSVIWVSTFRRVLWPM